MARVFTLNKASLLLSAAAWETHLILVSFLQNREIQTRDEAEASQIAGKGKRRKAYAQARAQAEADADDDGAGAATAGATARHFASRRGDDAEDDGDAVFDDTLASDIDDEGGASASEGDDAVDRPLGPDGKPLPGQKTSTAAKSKVKTPVAAGGRVADADADRNKAADELGLYYRAVEAQRQRRLARQRARQQGHGPGQGQGAVPIASDAAGTASSTADSNATAADASLPDPAQLRDSDIDDSFFSDVRCWPSLYHYSILFLCVWSVGFGKRSCRR
jgi:hypothetical protein